MHAVHAEFIVNELFGAVVWAQIAFHFTQMVREMRFKDIIQLLQKTLAHLLILSNPTLLPYCGLSLPISQQSDQFSSTSFYRPPR